MDLPTYFTQPNSLTQTQLAEKVGISQSQISNYVTGRRRPTRHTAVAISEATGGLVSVGELLSHAIPDGYELVRKEVVA